MPDTVSTAVAVAVGAGLSGAVMALWVAWRKTLDTMDALNREWRAETHLVHTKYEELLGRSVEGDKLAGEIGIGLTSKLDQVLGALDRIERKS